MPSPSGPGIPELSGFAVVETKMCSRRNTIVSQFVYAQKGVRARARELLLALCLLRNAGNTHKKTYSKDRLDGDSEAESEKEPLSNRLCAMFNISRMSRRNLGRLSRITAAAEANNTRARTKEAGNALGHHMLT